MAAVSDQTNRQMLVKHVRCIKCLNILTTNCKKCNLMHNIKKGTCFDLGKLNLFRSGRWGVLLPILGYVPSLSSKIIMVTLSTIDC